MLAKDLISDIIPALKTSDTGMDALNWMEVFRVSHLPIVNNKDFLGLISDTDIYDLNSADEPLGNHPLSFFKPYVFENQHIYDVLEILSRLRLTIVPVLDNDHNFLGVITTNDLLQKVATLVDASTPGGIIELEVKEIDYSLSEIARIVEDADSKILSIYCNQHPFSKQLKITLKINRIDISPVLHAFDRYGYTVLRSFNELSQLDDSSQKNYDALMKYMSI